MTHRLSTALLLTVAFAAGGQGECQLPGGQRIDAQFPTAWGLNLARNGQSADGEAAAP